MNEKMMKLYGVEPFYKQIGWDPCEYTKEDLKEMGIKTSGMKKFLPEFTKDKAGDLLEFLQQFVEHISLCSDHMWLTLSESGEDIISDKNIGLSSPLEFFADLMCELHEHLTDEQRIQVKEILENNKN